MDWPGEQIVIKLWETVTEKGIGKLLSPWQTRREGRAQAETRAHEMLLLAQAEADAADLKAGRKRLHSDGTTLLSFSVDQTPDMPLIGRRDRVEPVLDLPRIMSVAMHHTAAELAQGEINASRAVLYAEETLIDSEKLASEEPVDDDWLSAWRDHVGKVSNVDLQRLWGRVLAGEVTTPGTYSLRTLEFLRTLSKAEAELIEKLGPFVFSGDKIMRSAAQRMEKKGLPFERLMQLQHLGILAGVEAIGMTMTIKSDIQGKFLQGMPVRNKILIIEKEHPDTLALEVYVLTDLGKQILSLANFDADSEYMHIVGKDIVAKGYKVTLADWEPKDGTTGNYKNGVRIVA